MANQESKGQRWLILNLLFLWSRLPSNRIHVHLFVFFHPINLVASADEVVKTMIDHMTNPDSQSHLPLKSDVCQVSFWTKSKEMWEENKKNGVTVQILMAPTVYQCHRSSITFQALPQCRLFTPTQHTHSFRWVLFTPLRVLLRVVFMHAFHAWGDLYRKKNIALILFCYVLITNKYVLTTNK